MILNVIVGFVLPWIFGAWLLIKNWKLLYPFFPAAVALASVINNVGFNYFWLLSPQFRNVAFSAIPFDLGLFPVSACFVLYFVYKKGARPWPLIFLNAILLTTLEWILKEQGRVIYSNGWNVFWTFFSYLIPIIILYWYSVVFFKLYRKT